MGPGTAKRPAGTPEISLCSILVAPKPKKLKPRSGRNVRVGLPNAALTHTTPPGSRLQCAANFGIGASPPKQRQPPPNSAFSHDGTTIFASLYIIYHNTMGMSTSFFRRRLAIGANVSAPFLAANLILGLLPPCAGTARVLPHGKPGFQFGEWPEAFVLPLAPFGIRPSGSDPAAGRRPERQAATGAGTPRELVPVQRLAADIPAVLETFQSSAQCWKRCWKAPEIHLRGGPSQLGCAGVNQMPKTELRPVKAVFDKAVKVERFSERSLFDQTESLRAWSPVARLSAELEKLL